MTASPKLGFVPILRTTFDVPFARELATSAADQLIHSVHDLYMPDEPVTNLEAAQKVAIELSSQELTALIIFQATFADSTMLLSIVKNINIPVMLWASPEPHTGGRLRSNSLCGINLGGHALTRAGIPYEYVYGAPEHSATQEKINQFIRAAWVKQQLHGLQLGRVGENPDGFDTCIINNEGLHESFGINVIQLDLQSQVFEPARQRAKEPIQAAGLKLAEKVSGVDIEDPATQGTLSTYLTLKEIANNQHLSGYAVRCWPEFFTDLGCAACGAMSMLSDEMIPSSCEADINGTLTQFILQSLSGTPAFGTDMVSIDEERNAVVIWHCGLAPLSMANPKDKAKATIHSNRRLPLLMDFTLKPGTVTVARISEATGSFRMVIGIGEIIAAPPSFSGTSGLIRFNKPVREILDTIMYEGLEHHISLTYGDYTHELKTLARMLNLSVLEL